MLLKQYRHAIRRMQYAFPRGFAEEDDKTPADNAIRELQEEIHAVITKSPVFLGRIVADSGLTGGCAYPDVVVNFAAESHVDRSIESPETFLDTNIKGTAVLMDACIKYQVGRFHQISTDEVYGDLPLDRPELLFTEETPLCTSSSYSSSKAAADFPTTLRRLSMDTRLVAREKQLESWALIIQECKNGGLKTKDWLAQRAPE